MFTKLVLSFLLFGLLSASEVDNGFYDGRSGQVIIKPQSIQDDSFVLLRHGFSSQTEDIGVGESIRDVEFAGLLSHALGGPYLPLVSTKATHTLFQKARANLLFVIDGMGSEIASEIPMRVMDGKRVKITKTSYPQDQIATVATLLSGTTPSEHGIIGSFWRNSEGEISAYKAQAAPLVAGIFDLINQSTGGNSFIFSASSDYQLSSALGAHQYFVSDNCVGIYYNTQTATFENIYSSPYPSLVISETSLLENLSERSSLFQYNPTTQIATITLNGEPVSFDLHNYEDSMLFLEVEYLLNFLEMLDQEDLKSMVSDSNPDLYSFAFSSVRIIKDAYGRHSKAFRAAVQLVDGAISIALERVNSLYNGHIASEIIYLGTPVSAHLKENEKAKDAIFTVLFEEVRNKAFFDRYYPVVYTSMDISHLCTDVETAASNYDLKAYCGIGTLPMTFQFEHQTTNGTTPGLSRAANFQISLWFTIGIILVLIAIVYAVYNMDVGADSIIYRFGGVKSHQL